MVIACCNIDNITGPIQPCYVQLNESSLPTDSPKIPRTLDIFCYYVVGCLLSTLVITGLIGNVLTIFLFNLKSLWAQVNYYLIGLASWDIALLLSAWFAFSLPTFMFRGQFGFSESWIVVTYPFSYALCNITMTGCVWVTVTLTIERYLAVCHPLRHRSFSTSWHAHFAMVVVSFMAIAYGIPRYFELQIQDCYDHGLKPVNLVSRSQNLMNNELYFTIYRVVGGLALCSLGPFCILFILTALMIKMLRRSSIDRLVLRSTGNTKSKPAISQKEASSGTPLNMENTEKREKSEKSEKSGNCGKRPPKERSVNQLLSLVLIKFLLCHTLPTAIDILQKALPAKQYNNKVFVYLVEISNILVVLHSTTNFFIYVMFGSKVRRECFRMIFRHIRQRSPVNYRSLSMNNTNNWSTLDRERCRPSFNQTAPEYVFEGNIENNQSPKLLRGQSYNYKSIMKSLSITETI